MGDSLTRVLSRMLDLLALDNPRGTAVGAFGGSFMIFVVQLCRPLLERQNLIDPLDVPGILYICAGIFLANVTRAFRRDSLPQDLETAIRLITLGVRTRRLSPDDASRMYREVVDRALAQSSETKSRERVKTTDSATS